MGQRGELKMIETSVNRRWKFDKSLAEKAVEEGLRSPDDRVKARALAIAVAMEKQNQHDEFKVLDIDSQHRRDRLAALATRLGVDPAVIGFAANGEGGNIAGYGSTSDEREANDPIGPRPGESQEGV